VLLDHLEYRRLGRERQVTDLVEEESSPLCLLEVTDVSARRPGEGAGLVAEELGFQQRPGNPGTVDHHEGSIAPRAQPVNGPRDHVLPRAAGPRDEHVGRSVGDGLNQLAHLDHGLRMAQDSRRLRSHLVAERCQLAPESMSLQ